MDSPLASREGRLAIGGRSGLARRDLLAVAAFSLAAGTPNFAWAAAPQGQLTWAVHVSLAPTWFDPAETPGIITPFMELYALHDAMLKPMPGNMAAPSLAAVMGFHWCPRRWRRAIKRPMRQLSFRAVEEGGGEGLERFERGVFL